MDKPFTRRGRIRALTYLAAAFLLLFAIIIRLSLRASRYKQLVKLSYLSAFAQLTDSVDEMNTALEKCTYVTSPAMVSGLCTQLYGESLTAQAAIGELPYGNVELEQTAAFVSKVGAYAEALSRSSAADGYSVEDTDTVAALSEAAADLSDRLDELEAALIDGSLTLEDAEAIEERLTAQSGSDSLLSGSSYEAIETDFPELPTLIYDGPFSDHLESSSPAMLEHANPVTEAQARQKAASCLALEATEFFDGELTEGELPCYRFSCGKECSVEITRSGGYLLSYSNGRALGAETLSKDEALQKAREFLDALGVHDMAETYFIDRGNSLTINFAWKVGEVLCYPDLIKVEVAMDTGEVIGYEASGYLSHHTQRDALTPAVSQQQAEQALSSRLTRLSTQLALIPTGGEKEILCWEMKCQNAEGQHYLVYINAATGAEQQILILLEDDTGSLVI